MIINNKNFFPILLYVLFTIVSCSGGEMDNISIADASISDVTGEAWKKLETRNIYFGHKSVGYNIIEGIEIILQENKTINLNISKAQVMDRNTKGIFLHSPIGQNRFPQTKMDAFKENLEKNENRGLDFAFMKFCYLDVNPDTNSEEFFESYRRAMNEIKMKYPELKLVYVTIPLKTVKPIGFMNNVKEMVKSVLGRGSVAQEKISNYKRLKINNMIRAEYGKAGLLFDLAMLESTKENGEQNTFDYNGEKVEALNPAYSIDGGHLNEKGKKYIAEKLLIFLAQNSN